MSEMKLSEVVLDTLSKCKIENGNTLFKQKTDMTSLTINTFENCRSHFSLLW